VPRRGRAGIEEAGPDVLVAALSKSPTATTAMRSGRYQSV
jgi:hypothetical protein